MRQAAITRKTGETDISLALTLEGGGGYDVRTGCGFFDHMLALFARHGRFDLTVRCAGDTNVDDHHTVEDVGIALGQAIGEALSDKRGIARYGSVTLPMDEALCLCAVDLSGRGFLAFDATMPCQKVGTFDTELVREFFAAVAREAKITLHIRLLAGENTHHIIESAFKAFARALRAAVAPDPGAADDIPSTKGVL